MGDGLKLTKDKRHRSSSSLAGAALEGTRSERKLDQNMSIPELDDQFTIAEERCDDLQEKINLIKSLKRKKKLKKRSMTRIAEPPKTPDNVPFISVRTQPKKKASQQTARLRRLEVPPNPTRGYLDPATVEQHRMIGQVRGYHHSFKQPHQEQSRNENMQASADQRPYLKLKRQRSHPDGDSTCSTNSRLAGDGPESLPGARDDASQASANYELYKRLPEYNVVGSGKRPAEKHSPHRRRHVPRDVPTREGSVRTERVAEAWRGGQGEMVPVARRKPAQQRSLQRSAGSQQLEERAVVELFSKSRAPAGSPGRRQGLAPQGPAPAVLAPMLPAPVNPPVPLEKKVKKVRNVHKFETECIDLMESVPTSMEPKNEGTHHPRRVRYRSRGYEMPTVASQMKHAGVRSYYGNPNHSNIPFVVSKSTAPSHNIGVNIQQVLNGLKQQQPLSGIPLTIAHHMGLGHVPIYGAKTINQQPSLDHHREMNAIRVGQRLVKLPSYKSISYNRLLSLYREGDGMVPRFLRAINRPQYFYTSMYNLATNREDFDCATSKGRGGSQEAKQSLAEYASLYREYERVERCLREGGAEPELQRRKEELTRELAAREDHIRKVVHEFKAAGEAEAPLRASASTAEDGCRQLFKVGEAQ
ncbi:hypothetical protein PYW07_000667 [Mythimna separata]|uniref:Uncharacterized protein n=1 Tax=Mythimna separata TaxID=271217 RepID=A0AAD8E0R4_MYTSE|nr:hypothetical protein PYW07_000667 [Mythimna separata]